MSTAKAERNAPTGAGPSAVFSDYFNEICQFFAGIEIYPFTVRASIGQTPVTFALNPYQIIVGCRRLAGLITVRLNLDFNFHDRPLPTGTMEHTRHVRIAASRRAEKRSGGSLERTG
jgi:hypothetical protein